MDNITIANTIASQMGGIGRLTAMTGAKNYVAIDQGLQFQLPAKAHFVKQGINRIQIILTPADTYTVKGLKWLPRKHEMKQIEVIEGVYCDQLQSVFTELTGLDTHL